MALRLVRKTTDTPNVTNKDDAIMTRYAYGGYNGVVKAFGSECNYTAENGVFKVLDGRIVIDGWEIDIGGAGVIFDYRIVSGTQYYSVYAEVNVSIESVKLDSTYLSGSYPGISKGDDLTEIPNGTARLLLYNVRVENGSIREVVKKFNIIAYLTQQVAGTEKDLSNLKKGLEDGTIKPANSTTVNGLEIIKAENGKLKIGNIIIPQKKLLWENSSLVFSSGFIEAIKGMKAEELMDKTFELEYVAKNPSAAYKPVNFFLKTKFTELPTSNAISIVFYVSPLGEYNSEKIAFYPVKNSDNNYGLTISIKASVSYSAFLCPVRIYEIIE